MRQRKFPVPMFYNELKKKTKNQLVIRSKEVNLNTFLIKPIMTQHISVHLRIEITA